MYGASVRGLLIRWTTLVKSTVLVLCVSIQLLNPLCWSTISFLCERDSRTVLRNPCGVLVCLVSLLVAIRALVCVSLTTVWSVQ